MQSSDRHGLDRNADTAGGAHPSVLSRRVLLGGAVTAGIALLAACDRQPPPGASHGFAAPGASRSTSGPDGGVPRAGRDASPSGAGSPVAAHGSAPAGPDSGAGRSATTRPRGITVTDQRGRTLTFDRAVTRIVTLPMPAAAIVVAVDQTADHLVGMHNASWLAMKGGILGTIFPRSLTIPHDVADNSFVPNVESILSLNPDVVIQWADEGNGIIAPIENAGLKVLGVTYGTQADVDTWLTLFASILGKPDRATAMTQRMRTLTAQVTSRTATQSGRAPTVLYFNRFSGGLKVAGPGTFNDYYITLVGCANPASGRGGLSQKGMVGVDVEQVLRWDPDIILLGNFDDAMPDDVYGNPAWQHIGAVRQHRVYKVPLGGYRWDPPSEESPLMYSWLSHLAFPGAGSDLRATTTSYYRFLYRHTLTPSELDTILWFTVNDKSANYAQFAAA